MRVVVTAGGTSEPIDDVRVITNFSTGRFGAAIANALARRGHEVVLLAGRALASHREWVDPEVRIVPFGSFVDLDAALTAETATPPDVLFMAAAVSDYTPVRAAGKIRSDQEELTITLKRNPKLLATLRERCPHALLVGFKLLSGVTEEELVRVGRQYIVNNRLDLVVANDLQHLVGAAHPIVLVEPESAERRAGTKESAAAWLADRVEAARGVEPRSTPAGEWDELSEERPFVPLDGLDERRRDRVIVALGARPARVLAVADDLWTQHGWAVRGEVGGLAILEAPTPAGRIEAASVCLLDPIGRRVLIGRRRTPPWEGYWAFPGGRRHPGEDLLATGIRELEEETGIRVERPRPVRERRVFVGADPGFVVTNFVIPVDRAHPPVASAELEARWVDLADVASLRPMAGGTRLVLAGIDRVRW